MSVCFFVSSFVCWFVSLSVSSTDKDDADDNDDDDDANGMNDDGDNGENDSTMMMMTIMMMMMMMTKTQIVQKTFVDYWFLVQYSTKFFVRFVVVAAQHNQLGLLVFGVFPILPIH